MKTKSLCQRILPLNSIVILITGLLISVNIFAQTFNRDYQDGRIYFKYLDTIPLNFAVRADNSVDMDDIPFIAALKKDFRLNSVERPFDLNNDTKLIHTFMLEFEDFEKIDQIISKLNEVQELEYAERVPLDKISYVPNDTLYNMNNGSSNWKWHLDRIQAAEAWDITKGSAGIKVAIVDNAVWADHPDLAGKIVAERDVVGNTNNSNPPATGDPFAWSHGTHCAGLAAASSDNSIGVASVGYDVSIIAVKAASSSNPENISGGYSGIQWAANNGADVISLSWGNYGFSQTNQNLINTVHNMGVVLIAAAGNDNITTPHYPSAYNNVISIASTDGNDIKSDFSNYGTTIDLCAPGGSNPGGPSGLLSTTYSSSTYGNYDLMQGTSMATPVASGLAGLILSVNPGLTPAEVEDILKSTSDDISALNPDYIGMLGAGRINAYQAVINTPFNPTANFSTPVTTIEPGASINFEDISTGVPSQWEWTFAGGSPSSSTDENPTGITYSTAGTYNVTLTVTNDFGTNTLSTNNYITVTSTPLPYIFISVSDTNPCIGSSVILKDSSLYNPTAWEWYFDPATVTFLNGTTATSQNAEVKFLASGAYTMGHRVWNANGLSTQSYENLFHVQGAAPDYDLTMEDGTSGYFILWDTVKSQAKVDARAAFESNFGIHLQGVPTPVGWKGGPTTTTADQAWNGNRAFQAEAHICGVDATGIPYVVLSMDLRQTYSLGPLFSWFRVLVNGEQIPDNHGVMDFNPVTLADDPWTRLYFDLSAYTGSVFDITLQSSCRFSDKAQGEGDNVFIDNLSITNTTVTGINKLSNTLVSIFPNPSDGRIRVTTGSFTDGNALITVSSMIGNALYSKTVPSVNGEINQNLDLSFLAPGMYTLTITDSHNQLNQRLVIR
jgi:subtilisin family serine protease